MTPYQLLQQQKGDAATCVLCMLSVGFDTQTLSRRVAYAQATGVHVGYLFT